MRASAGSENLAACLEISRAAVAQGSPDALPAAELALQMAQAGANAVSLAGAHRARGQALRAAGRHQDALEALDAASRAAEEAGDARLARQVLIGKIDSLGWLGRNTEAFALAQRLARELNALGAPLDAARALTNAGNLHFRKDEYRQAQDCYDRARQSFEAAGDELSAARVKANCGNTLPFLGRVDEALAQFAEARETLAAAGEDVIAAMIDASAGYLHFLSGHHSAALKGLTAARNEFAARGLSLETAKCDADTADVYRELNLEPEALECYERAITCFERRGVEYERARAELGRAAILAASGRTDQALSALDTADRLFARHKNGLQRAHVKLVRARLLHLQGRDQNAVAEARSARAMMIRRGARASAASARLLEVEILQAGDAGSTRMLLHVCRVASQHARRWTEARAHRALGLSYQRRGDAASAIRHFRLGVRALEEARATVASEELHVAFLRDKMAVYEDLTLALLARGRRRDIAEALETVERSRSRLLLERLQTAIDQPGRHEHETSQMDEQIGAIRTELSRGYHRLFEQEEGSPRRLASGTETAVDIEALEKQYERLVREAEISTAYSPISAGRSVSAQELAEALAPDETLVEFFTAGGRVGAFVVTQAGVHVEPCLASASEVEFAARRLRRQMQRAGLQRRYVQSRAGEMRASTDALLEQLYCALMQPLEARLKTEKLVAVPHGPVHGIPLHALRLNGRYALDRFEIVYAPSAAVWVSAARRGTHEQAGAPLLGSALIMGLPEPGIRYVAREVEQTAGILKGAAVFTGRQATLDALRREAPGRSIVHIATHALFRRDNALFSGLRLADGWLLARDLYRMPLRGALVTLSACRTGEALVDAGDEQFGLVRGCLGAGARAVVASLWPADDAATAALMQRFYTLLAAGHTWSGALRQAQLDLRLHYPHPYHWAAFTLCGER